MSRSTFCGPPGFPRSVVSQQKALYPIKRGTYKPLQVNRAIAAPGIFIPLTTARLQVGAPNFYH